MALFWFQERAVKSDRSNTPDISMCCMKGQVDIPLLQQPPPLLLNLIRGRDHRSSHFRENIRAYNSMFAFTSMGGKVDTSRNDGGGPPQFILSGQNYHRIGSLLPTEGHTPKYAQLYIYDTQNEISNRLSHFRYISELPIFHTNIKYLLNKLTSYLFSVLMIHELIV